MPCDTQEISSKAREQSIEYQPFDEDGRFTIESASLRSALSQQGLDTTVINLCFHVYKAKLSPQQIDQMRYPAELPFFKHIMGQFDSNIGLQLHLLREGVQKVALRCQCAGYPSQLLTRKSVMVTGDDESHDTTPSQDAMPMTLNLAKDDCRPAVWWSLYRTLQIMEYGFSNSHHLALYKLMVAHEKSQGKQAQFDIGAKSAVDDIKSLVAWALECIDTQNYLVTEKGNLLRPVFSCKGIPYHSNCGDMQSMLREPVRSMH